MRLRMRGARRLSRYAFEPHVVLAVQVRRPRDLLLLDGWCAMTATTIDPADWCVTVRNLSICGTTDEETHRKPWGVRWCFHCRTRHEFWWVVYSPIGLSYYGPRGAVEGVKPDCSDLFPGWYREWSEE